MDAFWIITVFEITDRLMEQGGHRSHVLAGVPDAEVITVAVVAAKYFQNQHERTLAVLTPAHYLSGHLSTSRFNRRLHALADWLGFILETLGAVFRQGEVFVLDSLAVPVCKRVRAPLSQGARTHLLWVLCRQERKVLWLAAASGLYAGRRAGQLYDPAGVIA